MARLDFAAHDMIEGVAPVDTPDALFELGLVYSTGRDVEPDIVQAHKWFNLAALRGSETARHYRTELAAEMSKEEIREAQKMARAWLKLQ
ncbi:MAG: SEL1-like repeat protein [Hyphomicrobiaceae bacterium]